MSALAVLLFAFLPLIAGSIAMIIGIWKWRRLAKLDRSFAKPFWSQRGGFQEAVIPYTRMARKLAVPLDDGPSELARRETRSVAIAFRVVVLVGYRAYALSAVFYDL